MTLDPSEERNLSRESEAAMMSPRDADTMDAKMDAMRAEIARLTSELESLQAECDNLEIDSGRHLAMLINERLRSNQLARERDEAREAACWLLGRTNGFSDENEAIKKYPWLDYHA